jgi:hypothetical protein
MPHDLSVWYVYLKKKKVMYRNHIRHDKLWATGYIDKEKRNMISILLEGFKKYVYISQR